MARHVYNLDLTDLPLDRMAETKNKRVRRLTSRTENSASGNIIESGHNVIVRQDSTAPDGQVIIKHIRPGLTRSYSETNLAVKRKQTSKTVVSNWYLIYVLNLSIKFFAW